MKFIFAVVSCVVLISFTAYAEDMQSIKKAEDKTSVKFIFCDNVLNIGKCKITARFESLESCERYKKFFTAPCDEVSQAGKIICDTNPGKSGNNKLYSAYCLFD